MTQYNGRHLKEKRLISKEWRKSAVGKYKKLLERGRVKGVSVEITQDNFVLWFNNQAKVCHYCGVVLHKDYQDGYLRGLTIDRKDNNKPYEIDNIVLACQRCNSMKGSWLNEEQMLDAAQRYFERE